MNEKLILLIFSIPLLLSFLFIRYLNIQKKKGIIQLVSFKHVDGINELAKEIDVRISFEESKLKIDNIKIPIYSIDKLEISSSKQLVEKDKSVINRAIIGSAMGGVGAIVGGISGINDGTKITKLMYYLTITFKDNSIAIFSFNRDGDRFDVENVIKRLR